MKKQVIIGLILFVTAAVLVYCCLWGQKEDEDEVLGTLVRSEQEDRMGGMSRADHALCADGSEC